MDRISRLSLWLLLIFPALAIGQPFLPQNSLYGNADPSNSHQPNPITIGTGFTVSGSYPNYTISANAGTGTVSTFSIVTANGFAGSVANPTTTPALTLTTNVTGILSGNGTAISAASTTGSGAVVEAISPALVTPALGTPSSGVMTNVTGLVLTTGVTGILPIANGGNGTSSPSLTAGTNIIITGSWPNYTINSSGGGGSPAFGSITSGSNSTATMHVAPGASLDSTGGPITATALSSLTGMPSEADQTLVGNGIGGPASPIALVLGCNLVNTPTTVGSTYPGGSLITSGSYAISSSDMCGALKSFNGTTTVTIASATTAGYTAGGSVDLSNVSSSASITVTPTTSTIFYNGVANATLTIPPNSFCTLRSNGTNYDVSYCMAVGSGSLPSIATSTGLANISGSTGTPTAVALGAQMIINVKSTAFAGGMKGDNSTDDYLAYNAALTAESVAWAAAIPAKIYFPASIYYLNHPVNQCPQYMACDFEGDEQYHTFFHLGTGFSGPLFSSDDAWSGAHPGGTMNGCTHTQPKYQFPPTGCTMGTTIKNLTITGEVANTNTISGMSFYDHNDHVLIENVTCHYVVGPCLDVGITKNDPLAYMRESNIYNLKSWDGGATLGAAIHIGSFTSGVTGCEASNEIRAWGLDIENSFGDGLVIDTNYDGTGCLKGTDNLMFFGARAEKGASNNDLIRIGGAPIPVTNANNGTPVANAFLCATNPCSLTGLVVDSTSHIGAQPGDIVTITGTNSGSAVITLGSSCTYTSGDTFLITATNNTSYFTLQVLNNQNNPSGCPAGTSVSVSTGTIATMKFSLNAGTNYNVLFAGLELTTVPSAGFGLHLTSQANTNVNAANNQYGIVVNGLYIVTGTGVGIQIDGGKGTSIKDAKLTNTLSTQLVVASNSTVGCCHYIENLGGSALTTTIDATSAANVGTIGTQNGNNYYVDLVGDVLAPSFISNGPVPVISGTGACSTLGTVRGGPVAADVACTGSTGASTITMTLPAAPRAYVCSGRDVTNPTTVTQTGALSTTSVTLTMTSVTHLDVISFACVTGY